MYIKRAIEKIGKKDFNLTKSIAFTGARQVGKSTMIGEIFPKIKKINLKDVFFKTDSKRGSS